MGVTLLTQRTPWFAIVAVLIATTGCVPDFNGLMEQSVTPGERDFARQYLTLLRDGQFDSAYAELATETRTTRVRAVMPMIADVLKDARLDSLRLVGFHKAEADGRKDLDLRFEIPTSQPGRWILASVQTRVERQLVVVYGFSSEPVAGSQEALNRFTFENRSLTHYLYLGLAAIMPLITIGAAVLVGKQRGLPKRWLWVFAALVGSPVFSLNWTTGQTALQNTLFILFGGAALKSGPAAPWILSFAVPLGAAVAYYKVRAWRAASTAAESTVIVASGASESVEPAQAGDR